MAKLLILLVLYFRSMKDRIKAQTFSFDQYFQAYQKDEFVQVK